MNAKTIFLIACTILFVLGELGHFASGQETIDFNRQIKPILSDNCFACHGPDAAQRPSDLRMDDRESVFSDLGGYQAIVAGKPDESEIVQRILSEDEDLVMPPSDHRKTLSDAEKQLIVEWVKQGAEWKQHWSFIGPEKKLPKNQSESRINFIDDYIAERRGRITQSPVAEKHTLLRRIHFDLIGLPPTPEQVERFQSGSESYEQAVERLLSNRHFGERMAVYWLDLVRYADSVGYHGDQPVSVTPYRDYVVEAFNRNLPFDQFTKEQLAGDLLENRTQSQWIASGYNRLGMMSAEGGVQPKEYLAKYASDRVRTTASVWLGVTLGCAECHDHKFDPFTTKEFYEFASFFADIKERGLYSGPDGPERWGPSVEVPDEELAGLLEPIDAELLQVKKQLEDTPEIISERKAWTKELLSPQTSWTAMLPLEFSSLHEVESTIKDDGSILIGGKQHDKNTYVIQVETPKANIKGIRLEVLPDPSLPKQGPGRAGNGNFVLSEFMMLNGEHKEIDELKMQSKEWSDHTRAYNISLTKASATIEQEYGGQRHPNKKWAAQSAIDQDKSGSQWGWAILPGAGKTQEWVVQLVADQVLDQDKLTFVIQQNHGNGNHTLGHFRLSFTSNEDAQADRLARLPDDVESAIRAEPEARTAAQQAAIAKQFISIAPRFKKINEEILAIEKNRKQVVARHTRTSLVTVAVKPRPMRVLARGNWMDTTGEVVSPNVPASLGGPNWEGKGTRLDLANWIVDPKNPLTARVFVNRLWRMFYGTGLSNVLDDLGSQGEPPSHPELLDRLAIEFVESGWDVKHMVKLMVMANTYRQSSNFRGDLIESDPENRLLARQSRFRLDAEFVRDNALFVSGLLNAEFGGNNGKPYQPPGLYRHLNFPRRKYESSTDQNQYRRGLYTHWQRQYLHPAMKTLDAPAREECTAARPRSSTPLAALLLLNDPSYVEAARSLAGRVLAKKLDDDKQRVEWLFQTCLSRSAAEEEVEVLDSLLAEHRTHFEANLADAEKLLNVGMAANKSDVSDSELAAWTSVCRAILNLHEFVLRK